MTNDVTLGAAARQNLSALQATSKLLGRTQSRLSTGLKVSSAVDDAVSYFQGRALGDRAKGLLEVKDGMVGAVGTIKTAMTALESVEKLLTQMKGVALAAKGEGDALARHHLYLQYSELRDQIDTLVGDSHYNGMNLIGNPANDLSVPLSPNGVTPVTKLDVAGISITSAALGLDPQTTDVTFSSYNSTPSVKAKFDTWANAVLAGATGGGYVATNTTISGFGANKVLNANGTLALYSDGDGVANMDAVKNIVSMTGSMQYEAVTSLKDYMATGGTSGDTVDDVVSGLADATFTTANYPSLTVSLLDNPWEDATYYLGNIDIDIAAVDAAITTVRSTMSSLGANLALLQVRGEFNQNMAEVATEGAAKLVNADLNEEGANMVALQTRSQLGLQALSLGGQADKAVLELF
ncbi:MAG: flagellin [Magnetospirillum gryphiswaldense]|nr:flagellin [Magnetospirillum gryphiswaldense]